MSDPVRTAYTSSGNRVVVGPTTVSIRAPYGPVLSFTHGEWAEVVGLVAGGEKAAA